MCINLGTLKKNLNEKKNAKTTTYMDTYQKLKER